MDIITQKLIKSESYTKAEIEAFGCEYIKETTITMYYRKENYLYIFNAKPDKNCKYKLLTIDIDN